MPYTDYGDTMNSDRLANRIYELRKSKGLSQKELGALVGVSNKAVSKWETGAAIPKTDILLKLADVFEISAQEFLEQVAEKIDKPRTLFDVAQDTEDLLCYDTRTAWLTELFSRNCAKWYLLGVAIYDERVCTVSSYDAEDWMDILKERLLLKSMSKKKIIWFAVSMCVFIFLFNGCYNIETSNAKRYHSFYNKMERKHPGIYERLPDPQGVQLEEVYLYHWDLDLIDTSYMIYLNCVYDNEEEYTTEKKRQYKLGEEWEHTQYNSASFDYESIVREQTIYEYERHFDYVLFDDDEQRIVYVYMFDFDRKFENIPQKYLPDELR